MHLKTSTQTVFCLLVTLLANLQFLFLNPVQYNDDGRAAEVPAEEVSC